jgi:hypothetical protein
MLGYCVFLKVMVTISMKKLVRGDACGFSFQSFSFRTRLNTEIHRYHS